MSEAVAAPRSTTASSAATPARCCAASAPASSAPATATPTSTASWCAPIRWCCWTARSNPAAARCAFLEGARDWSGELLRQPDAFVTGIGATTTYPDYKPAPFIVSSQVDGVDMRHRGDRGHLQLLRRQGEDRHRPLSRPRAGGGARQGRADRPRHHRRVRLADAVARRRAPPDRRLQGGRQRHLRRAACACATRKPSRCRSTAARASWCRPASAPIVDGTPEERMRVGCGSATIGIFAQQWFGHADEVIVVDDHITGVLSEHQAGRCLDMRPDRHQGPRPQVDARPLLPGRGTRPRLGRHRHHRPARDHRADSIRKVAWPGLRLLMVSTTGEQAAWFVLDEELTPRRADRPPTIAGGGAHRGELRAGAVHRAVHGRRRRQPARRRHRESGAAHASVKDALTRVTCGGAPAYVWPGGGITVMVDVARMPDALLRLRAHAGARRRRSSSRCGSKTTGDSAATWSTSCRWSTCWPTRRSKRGDAARGKSLAAEPAERRRTMSAQARCCRRTGCISQHGPIDLVISADGAPESTWPRHQAAAAISANILPEAGGRAGRAADTARRDRDRS